MRIVMVEWTDSHFARLGWTVRENEEPVVHFVSMGVLLSENENEMELVPNLGYEFKSQGTTIPKGCIKRIRTLQVKED